MATPSRRIPHTMAAMLALTVLLLLVGRAVCDDPIVPPGYTAPDVAQLLRGFDDLYDSPGTVALSEITIVRPGKTRTMRMRSWSKGEEKALIVIEAPVRDAGMATLKVGNNLWNYLPKISRVIRVPPSMMMGSWMGSDMTNDDLVRESSYLDDYAAELVGRSSDPPGWKVRLDALPDVPGLWNRVEVVFSDNGLPARLQFFDRKDRLSRTMVLEDVKRIGGRLVPTVMRVIPEREEGRSTEFRYLSIEFDVDLDDGMFSLAYLERKR
ncbi:outer membrane lipoprotein-sorting protein [bacterium]|nr:outer membrane lipoprotein-sorting protein [bacterium]